MKYKYKKKHNNFFKYIFVVVVIGLIVASIYFVYYQDKKGLSELEGDSGNKGLGNISVVDNVKMAIHEYDNINPLLTHNREVLNFTKLIFEPLVNITPEYGLEFRLAKSCQYKEDNKYEVKLDTEAKWHDGSDLKAEDVLFTFKKIQEGDSIYKANISNISSMERSDDETVIIKVNNFDPFFEYSLDFPIVCKHHYDEEDFNSSSKIPIGTGMYKIASNTQYSLLLTKNTKWAELHNREQTTESITVQKYSSIGEAYNAFKMGNLDIINTGMTDYQQYIGTMGYNIKTYAGRSYDYLALNCNDSILGDKSVRRAINYAINKDTINTSVFYGNRIVSNGFLDYGSFLYNGENLISYDQEKAKQELLNNGWSNADGTWKKDDRTIDINLTVNNDNQERINVAYNIKSQLSEIGIKVHVKQVSRDRYNQYLSDKNYDMILCGVNNSVSPKLNTFYGSGNIANYSCDEKLDSIDGIRNAQRKANEDIPYIGLYRNKWTIILNPSVGGELRPNAYCPYNNFDKWYRQI